ncbi:helix-turn-helix domain-containing protein [Paenibacillus sp. ACRSA]|uniref:helix-turn-helix domain-containing protein n=1 Tax=Paenibacillus sp. ACRSA TaxID=2918211 RepID=UPI001EF6DDC4|nr:helix-turn-helix domain-containing protein [Paenibacillus sp. ACRSA]MCG7378221.1 helix-turn-helix domain-containing protein [Paenibacillus sp. ACRSA]
MELNMTLNGLKLWKATGGFANEPHVHDDWYQLTLPVRGQCHLVQERHAYPLKAGMGIIAHPQTEHNFEIGSDSAVIVIKFRKPPLGSYEGAELSGGRTEFRPAQNFDPAEISSLFRSWHSILLDDMPDLLRVQETELAIETYLRRMLMGQENEIETVDTGTFIDPHLRRVLDYIHSAYTGPMDIDSMAMVAHQSRYHFMRSFKALTGSTPYQYLLNLRVEEASRRLRLTTDSVTTISYELGFSSVSQLYRAFQRVYVMTPMEYRNQV